MAGIVNEYVDDVDVPLWLDGAPDPPLALNTNVKLFVGSSMVILLVAYSPNPSSAVARTVMDPMLSSSMVHLPPVVVSVWLTIVALVDPEVIDHVT